ncbi:licD family protein [Roseburia sp. CAG:380]|jgi:lipopolysaccharide cholinephosphotransferase|uniref:LicD family protein n=1 Tax=Faecalibacillus faecis TaxID=1982628 RepID=UPI00033EFDFF|nr:licD family protein [Roseburia sp. CAG:380]
MSITLNEQDLQIIKSAELRIVNEINQICLRNNIKYSMIGGTLIGAVRHHGFIPWDDDIDLMMERSEYKRFLNIAEKELSEEFYIADYEHTPSIGEPFTKIMMKNTVMKESFTGSSNAPAGIFVDIFPVDNAPQSKLFKTIQRYKNYILRKKILIKSNYCFGKTGVKKFIYDTLERLTFESKSDLVRKYRNNQIKYNYRNTTEYVSLCGAYDYNRETLPKRWLSEYTFLEFEGQKLMAFKEYDKILRHYFGDYMKLPPENERICRHAVAELDLRQIGGRKA